MASYSLPEAARLRDQDTAKLRRFVMLNSVGLVGFVVAVGFVMAVLPGPVGQLLAGRNFEVAKQLLLPVVVVAGAGALQQGARVGMVAVRRSDLTLRIAITTGIATIASATAGAEIDGARGAAWGLAIVQVLQVFTWWAAFLRVLGDSERAPRRC
jgi:O-antigen/teichoic acid export membrane protein